MECATMRHGILLPDIFTHTKDDLFRLEFFIPEFFEKLI